MNFDKLQEGLDTFPSPVWNTNSIYVGLCVAQAGMLILANKDVHALWKAQQERKGQ